MCLRCLRFPSIQSPLRQRVPLLQVCRQALNARAPRRVLRTSCPFRRGVSHRHRSSVGSAPAAVPLRAVQPASPLESVGYSLPRMPEDLKIVTFKLYVDEMPRVIIPYKDKRDLFKQFKQKTRAIGISPSDIYEVGETSNPIHLRNADVLYDEVKRRGHLQAFVQSSQPSDVPQTARSPARRGSPSSDNCRHRHESHGRHRSSRRHHQEPSYVCFRTMYCGPRSCDCSCHCSACPRFYGY